MTCFLKEDSLPAPDPLIALLRLLGQGGLVTAGEAARRLGASEALVMAMVRRPAAARLRGAPGRGRGCGVRRMRAGGGLQ